MLIQAGFDIAFQCPAQTPMLLQLSIHPTRSADLRSPDIIRSDPNLAMSAPISTSSAIASHESTFLLALSRSPIDSSFMIQANWTRRRPIQIRRRSFVFPMRSCCFWSQAVIATATTLLISPGRPSEGFPAVTAACGPFAILSIRRSDSATQTRVPPVAPAIR